MREPDSSAAGRPVWSGGSKAMVGACLAVRWLYATALLAVGRPVKVSLPDLSPRPLRFIVRSAVERFRVIQYGGEREVTLLFLDSLKSDDVVYDVGASIGLLTVAAASRLLRGSVCAFEPDPTTRERLRENVTLNGLNNVQIVDWAVADGEGEVILYTDGVGGPAPSLLPPDPRQQLTSRVYVRTSSLDRALSDGELPVPDTLKIDVEGVEMLCLKGAQRLLTGEFGKRPRSLLVEVHPDLLPRSHTPPQGVRQFMHERGYKLSWARVRARQEHLYYVDPE